MSQAKPGMLLRHGAGLALVFLALLGWAARLGADNSAAASVGARWLNLEGDPRVTALGGAYAGLADGLPALGLNPGGLARLQGIQASLGDQIWDEDVSVQRLAYGQRLDQASALGLDLNYVNFGSIQTISIVGGYPVEGGTLNPYAGSLDLSYGRTLWGGLSAGVTAKLLTENLVGNSADALAADLGLLYAPVDRRWGLGASVLNLGGALDTAPLPL